MWESGSGRVGVGEWKGGSLHLSANGIPLSDAAFGAGCGLCGLRKLGGANVSLRIS